jgi:hypothetical protein
MPRLQAKLLRNARYVISMRPACVRPLLTNLTFSRHAKVSPDATAAPTVLLSLDDFAAASKEWEEREEQDDE